MPKTILITGSTDGIGLATARMLVPLGHHVLLHGRIPTKLQQTEKALSALPCAGRIASYLADLSHLSDVAALSTAVTEKHGELDVLINNAGVFRTAEARTQDGLDVRFAVNTIAPYLLTQRLLPLLGPSARVINLSSAAQSPVNLDALAGNVRLNDSQAYAQSKLAITMWSFHLAQTIGEHGPAVIAVNPASFLASKMVKDAYGVAGNDLQVGADILVRVALSDEFANASGQYFDNDQRRFAAPHADALDEGKNEQLVRAIEALLARLSS